MTGLWITLGIIAVLGISSWIGWSRLAKEHQEAKNLPIKEMDFKKLKNGSFHGAYEGGMYKWRINECQVDVASGKVVNIKLLTTKDPASKNMQADELYSRVIKAQSLQVDTISMATLTSKAYLKAVENALVQAEPI